MFSDDTMASSEETQECRILSPAKGPMDSLHCVGSCLVPDTQRSLYLTESHILGGREDQEKGCGLGSSFCLTNMSPSLGSYQRTYGRQGLFVSSCPHPDFSSGELALHQTSRTHCFIRLLPAELGHPTAK